MRDQTPQPDVERPSDSELRAEKAVCLTPLVGAALGIVALVWTMWPSFLVMASNWENDPQYSHGFLVPLFSIWLLYARRNQLTSNRFSPSWWGLLALGAGFLMLLAGGIFYFEWVRFVAIIPIVFGIVLLAGGTPAVRWAWPAVLFLFFMLPLPYSANVMLREPLRHIGTTASTYIMQTVGLPAFPEGNVIVVDEHRIGIEEVCSGLRMLTVFFALSAAVAILIQRPVWERLVIVASAVPIAIFANVIRITVTGILYVTLSGKTVFGMSGTDLAHRVFHDWAGWLMMPLALLFLWCELWILSRLFVVEEDRPMSTGLASPSESRSTTSSPVPLG
jgi:exosortase